MLNKYHITIFLLKFFLHTSNINTVILQNKKEEMMKDLKHLIFFENLLQDAQNELVRTADDYGKNDCS